YNTDEEPIPVLEIDCTPCKCVGYGTSVCPYVSVNQRRQCQGVLKERFKKLNSCKMRFLSMDGRLRSSNPPTQISPSTSLFSQIPSSCKGNQKTWGGFPVGPSENHRFHLAIIDQKVKEARGEENKRNKISAPSPKTVEIRDAVRPPMEADRSKKIQEGSIRLVCEATSR
ncbi:hypothetical protein AMTR_s00006p00259600, partial [Amborella trichopoda]